MVSLVMGEHANPQYGTHLPWQDLPNALMDLLLCLTGYPVAYAHVDAKAPMPFCIERDLVLIDSSAGAFLLFLQLA